MLSQWLKGEEKAFFFSSSSSPPHLPSPDNREKRAGYISQGSENVSLERICSAEIN